MTLQSIRQTLVEAFKLNSKTQLDNFLLNRILQAIELRFKPLEAQSGSLDEAIAAVRQVGLNRINEVLTPAIEQIIEVQSKGFLVANSSTVVTLGQGNITTFNVEDDAQRALFTPGPFSAITRIGSPDDYAIARTVSYNNDTGDYIVEILSVAGDPGPHNDWFIGAVAGSTIASLAHLAQTNAARAATITLRDQSAQSASAADGFSQAALGYRNQTQTLRTDTATDRTAVETGLGNFGKVYWGARNTPPPTGAGNAQIGAQYLDISTTPNTVKVLTANGWAPTVTVSVGGVRNQDFPLAAYANGYNFIVDGGFTRGDVLVNGVVMREGSDVTATPGVEGSFTLSRAIVATEPVSFRGYYASELTDFPTKAEVTQMLGGKKGLVFLTNAAYAALDPKDPDLFYLTYDEA